MAELVHFATKNLPCASSTKQVPAGGLAVAEAPLLHAEMYIDLLRPSWLDLT